MNSNISTEPFGANNGFISDSEMGALAGLQGANLHFLTRLENKETLYTEWGLTFSHIISRIATDRYRSRRELLIDLAAHLIWHGNCLNERYDYRAESFGDIRKSRDALYLAPPTPGNADEIKRFLSWCFHRLKKGEACDVEEIVFSSLLNIVANKPYYREFCSLVYLPETSGASMQPCISFHDPFLTGPVFDEDDMELSNCSDPAAKTLLRMTMIASNEFFWLYYTHRVMPFANLQDDDSVLTIRARLRPVA